MSTEQDSRGSVIDPRAAYYKLRDERDELLEALMDTISQACYVTGKEPEIVHDAGTSAYEGALALLDRLGYASPEGKHGHIYRLIWPEKESK